jgi:hypothetical protein
VKELLHEKAAEKEPYEDVVRPGPLTRTHMAEKQ